MSNKRGRDLNRLMPIQDHGAGTFKFWDSDSEDRFKENLKCQPEDWIYRTKPVSYKFNSDHYRTAEFDSIPWEESIVMFGTSNVFGIGLNVKDTVAGQLSGMTGVPVINLGVPGSSAHAVLYNCSLFRKNFPKPKGVIVECPEASRCTLFMPVPAVLDRSVFDVVNCGWWTDDPSDLGQAWRRYDMNIKMHLKLTRIAIQQMWSDVLYVDYHVFPSNRIVLPDCKYIEFVDTARDDSHPGIQTNYNTAEYIAKELNL